MNLEKAKALLDYNAETGVFTWKNDAGGKNRIKAGSVAGGLTEKGYVRISIKNKHYRAHRLAWLIMTGELPPCIIDHKDRNRSNNAWTNLRLATFSQNIFNSKTPISNRLGVKGVSKRRGRYIAGVHLGGSKRRHLGTFDTIEQARDAYCKAIAEAHGEFANLEGNL